MKSSLENIHYFDNSEPVLLSEYIYDQLGLKDQSFKSLLELGAIYVDDKRQVKDKWILKNSLFRIHSQPRRYDCLYNWAELIVYQNESFVILNKPSGLPSHPAIDNLIENSMTQASLALKIPLFVTHRLDTLTSGLIVYAKKKNFVTAFNQQLINRSIKKKYAALVESTAMKNQLITHFMDPDSAPPKKISEMSNSGWEICQLEILENKKINSSVTWVDLNLLTGRTHQIRAQLSFLGAPICGDRLYGSKINFAENAIALKAYQIEFVFDGEPFLFKIDPHF